MLLKGRKLWQRSKIFTFEMQGLNFELVKDVSFSKMSINFTLSHYLSRCGQTQKSFEKFKKSMYAKSRLTNNYYCMK